MSPAAYRRCRHRSPPAAACHAVAAPLKATTRLRRYASTFVGGSDGLFVLHHRDLHTPEMPFWRPTMFSLSDARRCAATRCALFQTQKEAAARVL
jgi:hypothetical protein